MLSDNVRCDKPQTPFLTSMHSSVQSHGPVFLSRLFPGVAEQLPSSRRSNQANMGTISHVGRDLETDPTWSSKRLGRTYPVGEMLEEVRKEKREARLHKSGCLLPGDRTLDPDAPSHRFD